MSILMKRGQGRARATINSHRGAKALAPLSFMLAALALIGAPQSSHAGECKAICTSMSATEACRGAGYKAVCTPYLSVEPRQCGTGEKRIGCELWHDPTGRGAMSAQTPDSSYANRLEGGLYSNEEIARLNALQQSIQAEKANASTPNRTNIGTHQSAQYQGEMNHIIASGQERAKAFTEGKEDGTSFQDSFGKWVDRDSKNSQHFAGTAGPPTESGAGENIRLEPGPVTDGISIQPVSGSNPSSANPGATVSTTSNSDPRNAGGGAGTPAANRGAGGGDSAPSQPEFTYTEKDFENSNRRISSDAEGIKDAQDAKGVSRVEDAEGGSRYVNENVTDPCATSATLDGKYSCKGTQDLVKGAQLSNQISQAAGGVATQTIGQAKTMEAQNSGTQSGAMDAAADTQQITGGLQMSLGAVNTILAIEQLKKASQHSSQGQDVQTQMKHANTRSNQDSGESSRTDDGSKQLQAGYVRGGDGTLADNAVENFQLNSQYQLYKTTLTQRDVENAQQAMIQAQQRAAANPQNPAAQMAVQQAQTEFQMRQQRYAMEMARRKQGMNTKERAIQSDLRRIGARVAGEQQSTAGEAEAGGIQSLTTGLGQITTGSLNLYSADQMRDAANNLRSAESSANHIALPTFGELPQGQAIAPRPANVITGSGTVSSGLGSESEASAGDLTSEEENDLANGFGDPLPPQTDADEIALGPPAEPFKTGTTPGGGGGGGGGGGLGGGATTAPATAGNDAEPSARYAELNRNSAGYAGGGGGYASMGGGGGGGGGGNGPDLSGLLAQFLPNKEEESRSGNSILDFGGRRNTAGEQPVSLLDKKINIFHRIHETYQEKTRKGAVGN